MRDREPESHPEPLQRSTLVDQIFEALRSDILGGRYEAGASLPAERALAATYGVTRTSLKHALSKLEQFGLIQTRHGVGSRVTDFAERGGLEFLGPLLANSESSRKLLADMLEIRVWMGGLLAELAAERADEAGLERLREIVARVEATIDEPASVQSLDMDFYRVLADISGNDALRMMVNSLATAYLESADDFVHIFQEAHPVLTGLRVLLERIEARDPQGAARAARAHLDANSRKLLAPDA